MLKKAQKVAEDIQSSTTEKVEEMLMTTMPVKREQGTLEATISEASSLRGNVSNTNFADTIDLDPPSPTYNIPLSIVYSNLYKDLAPSPSTKTSKKLDGDVVESDQPTIDKRVGEFLQHRIDLCQNLLVDHWFQPAILKQL